MAVINAYCKFSLKKGKTQKVADLLLSITFLSKQLNISR